MLRLTRKSDRAVLLLAHLAGRGEGVASARELAKELRLGVPTVAQILKRLASGGLLESVRGAGGGYRLSRPPASISLAEIVRLFEGPLALTDCAPASPGECTQESCCPARGPMRRLNAKLGAFLELVTLEELAGPGPRGRSAAESRTSKFDGEMKEMLG
jgi:Rrf2 family protein